MEAVANTIQEMFTKESPNIDVTLQEQVIRTMYQHRTVIPLFKGDDNINLSGNEWDLFGQMADDRALSEKQVKTVQKQCLKLPPTTRRLNLNYPALRE